MRMEGIIVVSNFLYFLPILTSSLTSLSLRLCISLLQGFDEYMNIVLDDAAEYNVKTNERTPVGRIMLKGDCITLMQRATP
jgi:hypothetical protein